jgi:hypothetical protein
MSLQYIKECHVRCWMGFYNLEDGRNQLKISVPHPLNDLSIDITFIHIYLDGYST